MKEKTNYTKWGRKNTEINIIMFHSLVKQWKKRVDIERVTREDTNNSYLQNYKKKTNRHENC